MQITPKLLILRRGPVENHVGEVSPIDTKLFILALIFTKIHDWHIKHRQRIEQVIVYLFIFKMNTFAVILLSRLMLHIGSAERLRFDINKNELVSYQWANPRIMLITSPILNKFLQMIAFVGAA